VFHGGPTVAEAQALNNATRADLRLLAKGPSRFHRASFTDRAAALTLDFVEAEGLQMAYVVEKVLN
jgi:hypothetical protein